MNEAEAEELASEINRYPGWIAHAEKELFLDSGNLDWWVQVHHSSMMKPGLVYPEVPVRSRDEWDALRQQYK